LSRQSGVRQDIISYLSTNGPIQDSEGRATSALKQALAFEGTDSAFVQLVSAMARAGQIERTVRGKRTYELRLPQSADGDAGRPPARPAAPKAPAPLAAAPSQAVSVQQTSPPHAAIVQQAAASQAATVQQVAPLQASSASGHAAGAAQGIDYDELASVLLARVTRILSDSEHGAGSNGWTKRRLERLETRNAVAERELARAKAELEAVAAERDELRSRLEAAERNLSVLTERFRSNVVQTSARRAARHLGAEDRALLHRLTGRQSHEEQRSEHTG
jgi:hypothetical protein